MKIYHNSRKSKYREPFGAAQVSSEIRLGLDVILEDGEHEGLLQEVNVRLWQDNIGETIVPMSNRNGRYEANITTPTEAGLLWYFFQVKYDGRTYFYGNNVNNTGGEGCMFDVQPSSYQITVYKYAPVPSWYKDGIVYQIFPDRFARDDKWHDRCEDEVQRCAGRGGQRKFIEENWYWPAYYIKDQDGKVTDWPFYGGSLKGIEEKLDYLTSMGVTAIYLNPIFEAASNHRYDTGNYMHIDPMLGTEEDFIILAKTAKDKGIRLILDGVFSHTGADSIYFDKYGNYGGEGAFNNVKSQYRDWYEFRENDPVGYRSWWGVEDLPEVNEGEEGFRDLICGDEGVLAKWLRAGASGWRLDVADELPDSFIADIRKRIKRESEDNLLLGEVWEDASNKISYGEKRQYLMGSELDSTMHYPLRDLLLDFISFSKGAWETGDRIMSLAENYPEEKFLGALNIIGSHDRERILTVMGAESNYDNAIAKVRILSVLQYTLPGVPCIYYGDEAGMTGGADPENRCGFIWDKENVSLQHHYRQLGVIYDEHPALKSGALDIVGVCDDNVLAFTRTNEDETLLVIVNRSDWEVEISKEFLDVAYTEYALELLNSRTIKTENGKIAENIKLGARDVAVICLRKEAPQTMDMKRGAGVICHVSSIPGGVLGKPARNFVDYLASAGMSVWQILPLNPPGVGDSPYSSNAAFAGNQAFINYDELPPEDDYEKFCIDNAQWLNPYAQYVAGDDQGEQEQIKLEQYYFAYQWNQLREYANSKGVSIMGDLPIFVSRESVDIYADSEQFQIDSEGHLKSHAGVPPDYFNEEGQDWGNPLYNWEHMDEDDYEWWTRRLEQCFERYDYVRLDHFRSFSEYFSIPEGETPISGRWQHGPGIKFFRRIAEKLGHGNALRILAEDLGQLDIGVYNLLKLSGLHGMKVWQFSADEIRNMNREETGRYVIFTGTHDNQTLYSWCKDNSQNDSQNSEATSEAAAQDAYEIIREMYESDAPLVMMQIQDMFMLDDSCRMNVPGVPEGNWKWQLHGKNITDTIEDADKIAKKFRQLAIETDRMTTNVAEQFLKDNSISVDNMNPEHLVDEMVSYYEQEISNGSIKGVPANNNFGNRKVISVDMGGTNTRITKVRIENNEPFLEKQIKFITPGRDSRVSIEQLFSKLAEKIGEVDPYSECFSVGFAFSFPAEPEGSDMRILSWDKEMQVDGGEGILIGELLRNKMAEQGQIDRAVTVANDTVATLKAGAYSLDKESIAGFVLGTGANICFLDKESQLIYNLESGSYPNFPRGKVDEMLDSQSSCPGGHLAEKMMSGAYIHDLIRLASEKAMTSEIIKAGRDEETSTTDEALLYEGVEAACLKRASLYSAVTIAAAVKMSKAGSGNYHVVVEGSTFWKIPGFNKMVSRYLDSILEKDNISIEFIQVDDAGVIGMAALA